MILIVLPFVVSRHELVSLKRQKIRTADALTVCDLYHRGIFIIFFVSSVENNNCDVRQNSGCLLLPFITNRWTLDSVHGAKRFNQACTIFLFVLTLSLVLSLFPPI